MKKPRVYFSGESFSVGLKWAVNGESVDVSGADDIKVSLIQRVMAQNVITFKKSDGTLAVSEDKCLATITGTATASLRGLAYILIEICVGGQWQKAVADQMIMFIKQD